MDTLKSLKGIRFLANGLSFLGRRGKGYALGAALASAMALPATAFGALTWDYANVPLFWASGINPNVALMLDDSGSMKEFTVNESFTKNKDEGTLSAQNWYWCNGTYNYSTKKCDTSKTGAISTMDVDVWAPPGVTATDHTISSSYIASNPTPATCSGTGFGRTGASGTTALNNTICYTNTFTNGTMLVFKSKTPTTNVISGLGAAGTTYYVTGRTNAGFQLSTSVTGTPIVSLGTGTGTGTGSVFTSGSFVFTSYKSGTLPDYIDNTNVSLCDVSKVPGTAGFYVGVSNSAPYLSSTTLPTADTVGVLVSDAANGSTGTKDSCVRWRMASTQRSSTSTVAAGRDGSATQYAVDGYPKHLLNSLVTAASTTANEFNFDSAAYPTTDSDPDNFTAADNRVIPDLNKIESARESAREVVRTNYKDMNIGLFSFNGSNYGEKDYSIGTEATQTTDRDNLIGTANNTPMTATGTSITDGKIGGLVASNYTPLGRTMYEIVQYFQGVTTSSLGGANYTTAGNKSPIQYRCQKNYSVLMTDGDPTQDSMSIAANTNPGDVAVTTNALMNWDNMTEDTGYSGAGCSSTSTCTWLDDIAQFAYDIDLKPTGSNDLGGKDYDGNIADPRDTRPGFTTFSKWKQQNIETFTVGFGLENDILKRTPLTNSITVVASDVDPVADTLKYTSHGLTTKDYVLVTNAGSSGLTAATSDTGTAGRYYVAGGFGDKFKLALSKSAAVTCAAGGAGCVNITAASNVVLSTGPGESFFAYTPQQLAKSLTTVFNKINKLKASASAVSASTKQLGTESLVFQGSFNTEDWSGKVTAYYIDKNNDGKLDKPLIEKWNSTSTLATYSQTAAGKGKLFTWREGVTAAGAGAIALNAGTLASLPATQQAGIGGAAGLSWYLGTALSAPYRPQPANGYLGDVLNADPLYVSAFNNGYSTDSCLPSGCPGSNAYAAYVATNRPTKDALTGLDIPNTGRKPMLYVGANDGMMHALEANTGDELMAFIPAGVFQDWVDTNGDGTKQAGEATENKLFSRTQDSYTGGSHRYFLDGLSTANDVWNGSAWKTYLVGALGRGGRSVFALDITDPASGFSTSNVLWEFTNPNLGYTYGKPLIARFADNEFYAVFANGLESRDGKASVFVVKMSDPTVYHELTIPLATTGNGMMAVQVALGPNRNVSAIYGGDMLGNIWRFNMSTAGSWPAGAKLFTATDNGGKAQAITGGIRLGVNADVAGTLVYFGTGKYFETKDGDYATHSNTPNPDADVHSFYAVLDAGDAASLGKTRTNLLQQTFTTSGTIRTSTANNTAPVSTNMYTSTVRGWYIDLLNNGTKEGERVVTAPLLAGGRIIFVSMVPISGDRCVATGTSWLNELNALDGNKLTDAVLDTDGDGDITDETTPVSSVSAEGFISEPTIISGTNKDLKIMGSTSEGNSIQGVAEKTGAATIPGGSGRMSWQQLQ
ncbi:MAG TPA: PilC/PilY family type IV pilus protein [Pseudomonadales bacterium]|nr:PilC/PilY family type IV pilus protein [Pseudomonadales bacterium]